MKHSVFCHTLWALVLFKPSVCGAKGGDSDSDGQENSGHPAENDSPASPTIVFTQAANATICDSTTFVWSSVAIQGNITLKVSNMNVTSHTKAANTPTVSNILVQSIDVTLQAFTWLAVNVPVGWYAVNASQSSGFQSQSPAFFISQGSDSSCVDGSGMTISSTSLLSLNTSSIPITSSTSHSQPWMSSQHSQTPTGHHFTHGQIIGISVGSLAAFLILGFAYTFPRWWRKALPQRRHSRGYILF